MSSPDASEPRRSTGRLDDSRASAQADFEVGLLTEVLNRVPCHTEALHVLAGHFAARKEFERALALDRRLVQLRPERPIPWFNLACSAACLGMTDIALDALDRSIALGYPLPERLGTDPDLRSLRRHPRFIRLVRRCRASLTF